MLEVVKGVADARVGHAHVLVYLVEQDRHQTGLPVVTMNDFGPLAAFQHEFQRCPAEEGEALVVVLVSIKHAAMKEILIRVRFDEEAPAAMDEPLAAGNLH